MNLFDLKKYLDLLMTSIVNFIPNVFGAVLLAIVGFWLIKKILKYVNHEFISQKLEPSVQVFFKSFISVGLKVLLLMLIAGILGIQTASFVTVFGAMGLAVGLALQGSLTNFAGGVLILLFKPFKIGDFVGVLNEQGYVKEIQIFNTVIVTLDNRTIILPNGILMNSNIINHSMEGILLVDLKVKIDFDRNFEEIKKIILDATLSNQKVLRNPPPEVYIAGIENNDLVISMRSYCKWEDYWPVYFENYEKIQAAMNASGIEVPREERFVFEMGRYEKKNPSSQLSSKN